MELQADHFLLVGRQPVDQAQQLFVRLRGLQRAARTRLVGAYAFLLPFREAGHAILLPDDIERAAAAHGEQPLDHVAIDRLRRLRHEAHEGILHHVAGTVGIAQQPRRVTRERRLVLGDGSFHESNVFMRLLPERRVGG